MCYSEVHGLENPGLDLILRYLFLFWLFMAAPVAYGSSLATDQIVAAATATP